MGEGKKKQMSGYYWIGALIIYFLLTWVVLPRLGVPT